MDGRVHANAGSAALDSTMQRMMMRRFASQAKDRETGDVVKAQRKALEHKERKQQWK